MINTDKNNDKKNNKNTNNNNNNNNNEKNNNTNRMRVWLWRSHTAMLPSEQHEKQILPSGDMDKA